MEDKFVPLTTDYIRAKERDLGIPPDMPFSQWLDWLTNLFIARQLERGRRARQSDFADWLGISQNNLSQYILGKRRPDVAIADSLAKRLGYAVYDRLGYPRKMPSDQALLKVVDAWPDFDANERKEIVENVKNIQDRRRQRQSKTTNSDTSYA